MTQKQFCEHKWKLGEAVWVLTCKNVNGFYINAFRMIKAKVVTIYKSYQDDFEKVVRLGIEVPELERFEYVPFRHEYGYIDLIDSDIVFFVEKAAKKYLARQQKNDNAIGRLKNCISLSEQKAEIANSALLYLKKVLADGL